MAVTVLPRGLARLVLLGVVLGTFACSSSNNGGNNAAAPTGVATRAPASAAASTASTTAATAARASATGAPGAASSPAAASSGGVPANAKVLKLGMVETLSGNFQTFGELGLTAVKIAVDDINARGGVVVGGQPYKLELTSKDLGSDPTKANSVVQGLIDDDKIRFMFGPTVAPPFVSIFQLTRAAKVIHVAPGGGFKSDDSAADEVKSGNGKYSFKTSPPTFLSATALVAGIVKDYPGIKNVQILFTGDANGQLFGPAIKSMLEKQGMTVDLTLYDPTTKDFTVQLTSIKQKKPDLLLYGTAATYTSTILRQAVELDVAPRFAGYGAELEDALGKATGKPLTQPSLFYVPPRDLNNPVTPKEQEYAAKLKKALNKDKFTALDGVSLYSYDFVFMLAEALKQANTVTDPDAIVAALEKVEYDGVLGKLKFDAGHSVSITQVTVCQVVNAQPKCELLP